MPKKIWELFPEYVRKSRVRRGEEAIGRIISLPSEEELFKSFSDKILLFKKSQKDSNIEILALYQRNTDGYYGLLISGWCVCNLCEHPIKKCFNGAQLQSLTDRMINNIVWCQSLDSLQECIIKYTSTKEFITAINKFVKTQSSDKVNQTKDLENRVAQLENHIAQIVITKYT